MVMFEHPRGEGRDARARETPPPMLGRRVHGTHTHHIRLGSRRSGARHQAVVIPNKGAPNVEGTLHGCLGVDFAWRTRFDMEVDLVRDQGLFVGTSRRTKTAGHA